MKKYVLGLGIVAMMMGVSTAAEAKSYTRYCVPYAMDNEVTNVSTYFSMTVEDLSDACDRGCENEWNDYMSGNYDKYYKTAMGMTSHNRLSDAKAAFYKHKRNARDWNAAFHHASDFRCSGD